MRISMQMIQNKLSLYEIVFQISVQDACKYRNVRLARTPECVYLQQTGEDVTLWGEDDDYIVIKEIEVQTAFFLIQDIFDFYMEWYEKLLRAIKEKNYQQVINDASDIFKNPVLFTDVNYKLIALSQQYPRGSVNQEWTHLYDFGYTSKRVYSYFNKYFSRMFSEKECRVHYFRSGITPQQTHGFISSMVRSDAYIMGRVSVMEYDHKISRADYDILELLAKTLSSYMKWETKDEKPVSFFSLITDILNGYAVDDSEIARLLDYRNWSEGDEYVFCQISFGNIPAMNYLETMNRFCSEFLGTGISLIYEDSIVAILNESTEKAYDKLRMLRSNINEEKVIIAISAPFYQLDKLQYYLKQTKYVIEHSNCVKDEDIFLFEQFAVSYILTSGSMIEKYYAINFGIHRLFRIDEQTGTDYISTLKYYLNNERSVTTTAANLFVHKNTLLYRMKKITDILGCDLDDAYLRKYLILSIDILTLFHDDN